jgi:hypothetical protein
VCRWWLDVRFGAGGIFESPHLDDAGAGGHYSYKQAIFSHSASFSEFTTSASSLLHFTHASYNWRSSSAVPESFIDHQYSNYRHGDHCY